MSVQLQLEEKIKRSFSPQYMEVINESHQHNVPKRSESHFKIIIVAEIFNNVSLVARHQKVYAALGQEMKGQVHALALHCYTDTEWQLKRNKAPRSPDCHGGTA